MLTALGVVFDMPPLPLYDILMNSFSVVVTFDFVSIVPLGCVMDFNFHRYLLLQSFFPMIIVVAASALHAFSQWRSERLGTRTGQDALSKVSEQAVSMTFLLIFLIYPSISSSVFAFFQCFPVDGASSYLRQVRGRVSCKLA